MRCKWISLLLITFISLNIVLPQDVLATSQSTLDTRKVIVTYYGEDDLTLANVIFLQSTLSGMFEEVVIIPFNELTVKKLDTANITVVYSKNKLPESSNQMNTLRAYKGELLAIGAGTKDFMQFSEWRFLDKVIIRHIGDTQLSGSKEIINIQPSKNAKVLMYGKEFDKEYPVIIQEGKTAFIALDDFFEDGKYEVTTSLFDLFQVKKPSTRLAYIRLEDISPASDPKLVRETGNYLINRGIPVYLALIPTYVNNETGKTIHLDEVPELVAVIDELVQKGAYIIMHGYTHTYRYTETGEGFEFWDSVLNQPITTLNTKEIPEKLKPIESFTNEEQYEQYIKPFRDIESNYLESKLESGLYSLAKIGLAPIAFEAPHYTMSSNGYKITSKYYSALFGQIQTSDNRWEIMIAPLFVSKPQILNGMTLYPETIGYVDPEKNNPIGEMKKKIDQVVQVPGAMLGGFYHPYLGIDYLEEMVALLEAVPDLQWLEINQDNHSVESDYINVSIDDDGKINVINNMTWKNEIKKMWAERPFETSLWFIVGLTGVFVTLFTVNIFMLRLRYRKRLFEERA